MMLNPSIESFKAEFGAPPTLRVISPGRVNLIGEHTDYNLLPVLPMAIGRGLKFWVRANNLPLIRARNTDPRFSPAEFSISEKIPMNPVGDWSNYIKAAAQTALPRILEADGKVSGFDCLVSSTLPPAAGLSSSSALVVGSYKCFAAVNDLSLDPMEEAELCRRAERYVGTAGGGMDQAIIMLGRKGYALHIEFDPLKTVEIPVPADARFFAVDSGERAEKSGAVRFEYNRRTFECDAGLLLMARHARQTQRCAARWRSLRDAIAECDAAGTSIEELACTALGRSAWSMESVCDQLAAECCDLLAAKMLPGPQDEFWVNFEGFRLLDRVSHVIGEARRVELFTKALLAGDLQGAGMLMNESHASCRDLYDISTRRIEELRNTIINLGALGARITGAGFGGCLVVLTTPARASEFKCQLWEQQFQHLASANDVLDVDAAIIDCEPSDGVRVFDVE